MSRNLSRSVCWDFDISSLYQLESPFISCFFFIARTSLYIWNSYSTKLTSKSIYSSQKRGRIGTVEIIQKLDDRKPKYVCFFLLCVFGRKKMIKVNYCYILIIKSRKMKNRDSYVFFLTISFPLLFFLFNLKREKNGRPSKKLLFTLFAFLLFFTLTKL